VQLFGLAHEICGEMGLGWCARLLMIERSLADGQGKGFPTQIATTLADKYGATAASLRQARVRVLAVLAMLDARLAHQPFLIGGSLTAADIYWATFANLLTPLSEAQMPGILPMIRDVYSGADADLLAAMTDRLRRHQQHV
jgi:glutathione S-transferase